MNAKAVQEFELTEEEASVLADLEHQLKEAIELIPSLEPTDQSDLARNIRNLVEQTIFYRLTTGFNQQLAKAWVSLLGEVLQQPVAIDEAMQDLEFEDEEYTFLYMVSETLLNKLWQTVVNPILCAYLAENISQWIPVMQWPADKYHAPTFINLVAVWQRFEQSL